MTTIDIDTKTHPRKEVRHVHPRTGETTRTKQAPREHTNIKAIVNRYRKTGEIDIRQIGSAIYGDFSGVEDYKTMLDRVQAAAEAFDALPAGLRTHLKNDPADLLDCVNDPERRKEALVLELVEPADEAEAAWLEGAFKPQPPEPTPAPNAGGTPPADGDGS